MPKITLLFVALHALLLLVLTAPIVARRVRKRIGIGFGDDEVMVRRIRAHGNFTEYVPLALLLLALLEGGGLASAWVWTFGMVLLLARVLHAFGLSRNAGSSPARAIGALLTFADLLAMAGAGLWMALR